MKTDPSYTCPVCKQVNPVDYRIARNELSEISECSECLGAVPDGVLAEAKLTNIGKAVQDSTFPGRIEMCLELTDKELSRNIDLVRLQMPRAIEQKNKTALRRLQLMEAEYAVARLIKFDSEIKDRPLPV